MKCETPQPLLDQPDWSRKRPHSRPDVFIQIYRFARDGFCFTSIQWEDGMKPPVAGRISVAILPFGPGP